MHGYQTVYFILGAERGRGSVKAVTFCCSLLCYPRPKKSSIPRSFPSKTKSREEQTKPNDKDASDPNAESHPPLLLEPQPPDHRHRIRCCQMLVDGNRSILRTSVLWETPLARVC